MIMALCICSISRAQEWNIIDEAIGKLPSKETPVSTKCHEVDSKIRFNDFYGEVKYRCSLDENDAFEFADIDAVLYENDLIQTE